MGKLYVNNTIINKSDEYLDLQKEYPIKCIGTAIGSTGYAVLPQQYWETINGSNFVKMSLVFISNGFNIEKKMETAGGYAGREIGNGLRVMDNNRPGVDSEFIGYLKDAFDDFVICDDNYNFSFITPLGYVSITYMSNFEDWDTLGSITGESVKGHLIKYSITGINQTNDPNNPDYYPLEFWFHKSIVKTEN